MAIRKHLSHDAKTRDKIRTSQLINRLEKFILSENDESNGSKVELSPAQVTAALGLIKKTLPDLASLSLDAKVEGKMSIIVETGVPRGE